jgi:eukaryotic-like serine/threonine-protein kinase
VCPVCGAPMADDPPISAITRISGWSGASFGQSAQAKPIAQGTLLAGRYQLVELLGTGGMGSVYKAKDLRLERLVALKLLPPSSVSDPEHKARFIREARAAAALDHPNICTVYEIEEAEGQTFIAMAYLKGQSLKETVRSAVIPIPEAVEFATQAADGLGCAHAHGVIHRDIKPANLFVTSGEVLKIIDFGLATVAGQAELTVEGTILGTVAYMSPEQVNADKVDHRTDIWSLGVVLYEMIGGQRPFGGDHGQSIIYSILQKEPKPLSALREDVSPELEKVVSKALTKSKDNRYLSMRELSESLRKLKDGSSGVTVTRTVSRSTARLPSLAVLPFVDMSSSKDQEYLCEGIAEDIINALMQVKGLRVVSRGSSFRFTGKAYDLAEVAQKLQVAAVLEGSVRREGDRLRISAHLIDATGGDKLWARRFDLEMKEVFAVQDEISLAIANALKLTLLDRQRDGLVKRYTEDMGAYAAYLKGRYFWGKRISDAVKKAVEFYQEALRRDPDYALAHAGLADAYILPGYYGMASPREVMPKGKEAALRALELDPTLAEGHTTLGVISSIYEHAWSKAESQFELAIQSNPNYAPAHSWYSLFTLIPLRRLDEALAHVRIAQQLDPLTPFVNTIVGMCHYFRRDYDAASEELRRVIILEPSFPTAHMFLGRSLWDSNEKSEAIESFRKAAELYPRNTLCAAHLAYATARCGAKDDAIRLLANLKTQSAASYVPATSLAILNLGVGNVGSAIGLFENAHDQRDLYSIWMAVDPLYDEVRSDPKFCNLLKKLGV